ncbi:MAG: hypothetical protein LBS01_02370 [Prevotellaceae bacterium]|jgi:hypothetical protein|nr:hypothetical protein [Prevotellaceae bacterium]
MKDKILALLKENFKGAREDGLNHIANVLSFQVNTDEEAKTLVDKFTAEQINSFITDWRKSADAEITKANQTFEANLKNKFDFVEKPKAEPSPNQKKDNVLDAEAIKTLLAEAMKPFAEKVSAFETQTVSANRREMIVKELENLPNSYKEKILKDFNRMSFADDNAFTTYFDETKTDVAAFSQELANKGLNAHDKPAFGSPNKDGVSAAVESYIKDTIENKGKNDLGGKSLI